MAKGIIHDWPWSELGIGRTADKQAIRDAYAGQRAKLDLSMRISAFARLTEAREKALFLASEMQREAARSEVEGDGAGGPAAPKSAAPEIASEENAPSHSRQDTARPAVTDLTRAPPAEPEPEILAEVAAPAQNATSPWAWAAKAEKPPQPNPPPENGDPAYEADYMAPGTPSAYIYESTGPTPFFQRYSLQKYGVWWLAGLLLLVSMCTGGDRQDRPEQPVVAEQERETSPAARRRMRAINNENMVDTLFGVQFTMADVAKASPQLAMDLSSAVERDPVDLEEAEARLRTQMLRIRPHVAREELLAIAALHLNWLHVARDAGGQTCREVTGRSFYDGVPELPAQERKVERELVARLLEAGSFSDIGAAAARPEIPEVVALAAVETTGISIPEMQAALNDYTHLQRCDVQIGLLEVMLDQADTVPNNAFYAF